ncbi:MAG: T9SS type A sorting domain-containing protein [Flavobacterium sp.]|nr:T9SS type A sorting domain-containing protein [Flavobacterium sp.]
MLALFYSGLFFGQENSFNKNLTPSAMFDNVFDAYGKQYLVSELQVTDNIATGAVAKGRIIITGNFTTYSGTATGNGIARLTATGALDTTFNTGTGFNSVISTTATIANIKKIMFLGDDIFICGAFSTYNGTQSQNIVKISQNGTIDGSFVGKASAKINDMVFDTSISPISKMYIGGQFFSYNRLLSNNSRLIKISTNTGDRDTFWNLNGNNFNNIVTSLALQPDTRLIIGGKFTTYNGFQANGITRIETSNGNQGRMADPNSKQTEVFSEINIYPNPSNGIFNLDLSNESELFDEITIFDVLGKRIFNQLVVNKTINNIDLSEFANGIYFAKLSNETKSLDFKLIKQ